MNRINPNQRWCRLSQVDLQELYDFIAAHPGLNISQLARLLGWSYSRLQHRLIALEAFQLLLYEDNAGCLYPFRGVDNNEEGGYNVEQKF